MERQTEEKDGKRIYTAEDCEETGNSMCLTEKVIVVRPDAFPGSVGNQLYFCMGGDGAEPDPVGQEVSGVSLDNGEKICLKRSQVLGTLKPHLLPEQAKLQLSQIRPVGALPIEENIPLYSGRCYREDGSYLAGVCLCNEKEAMDYVWMQRPYQNIVMLYDQDGSGVVEALAGKLIFPDRATFWKMQGPTDGWNMELT